MVKRGSMIRRNKNCLLFKNTTEQSFAGNSKILSNIKHICTSFSIVASPFRNAVRNRNCWMTSLDPPLFLYQWNLSITVSNIHAPSFSGSKYWQFFIVYDSNYFTLLTSFSSFTLIFFFCWLCFKNFLKQTASAASWTSYECLRSSRQLAYLILAQ